MFLYKWYIIKFGHLFSIYVIDIMYIHSRKNGDKILTHIGDMS